MSWLAAKTELDAQLKEKEMKEERKKKKKGKKETR